MLIHAAAGGVGHLAVQIAKARGAYVIGTASEAKHAFLRGLGADELIDYRQQDFAEAVKEIDVVLDTIGGDYFDRSLKVLRPGGFLISLTELIEPDRIAAAASLGISAGFTLVEADYAGMKALAGLVDAGQLRVEIDSVFPLAEAAAAHRHGETGRTTGKIVLAV
ncbi:NADP-dependent oxidoreductase [Fodinicola feengrottensis]|uniref:NADP-dependent oxidoreductase n=1 Tax=Fodinicola feengrottensis TaxID=435914 RepID=UPI0028BEA0FB|nr:NADP-dependent oxidoreductase [Fodinicola feengrottensis]